LKVLVKKSGDERVTASHLGLGEGLRKAKKKNPSTPKINDYYELQAAPTGTDG